jgi:hypothetical protein
MGGLVARGVAGNLRPPERGSRRRHREHRAFMSMPEAAMHENHSVEARKNEIRSAGQVFPVKPEAQSARMQAAPQQQFRFCVATADAAHIEPPLFGCENVRHAY